MLAALDHAEEAEKVQLAQLLAGFHKLAAQHNAPAAASSSTDAPTLDFIELGPLDALTPGGAADAPAWLRPLFSDPSLRRVLCREWEDDAWRAAAGWSGRGRFVVGAGHRAGRVGAAVADRVRGEARGDRQRRGARATNRRCQARQGGGVGRKARVRVFLVN